MKQELRFLSPYDRIRLLQSVPFFESLAAEELAALAEHTEEEHRRRGAHLIERGEADAVRVLVEGEAVMRRHGAVMRKIGPGCPIGFITVIAENEADAEVITTTRTMSLLIKRTVWLGLLEDRFPILHQALRATARQLREECRVTGLFPEARMREKEMTVGSLEGEFERLLLLREGLPFGSRDLFGLWNLARRATVVRFEVGDTLFSSEAVASDLIVLDAGNVKCKLPGQNREMRIGPGRAIGLVDALAEEPRSYTAIAEEVCTGLRIDREELFDMFEDHFDIALDCLAATSKAALEAMEKRALISSVVPSGFDRFS